MPLLTYSPHTHPPSVTYWLHTLTMYPAHTITLTHTPTISCTLQHSSQLVESGDEYSEEEEEEEEEEKDETDHVISFRHSRSREELMEGDMEEGGLGLGADGRRGYQSGYIQLDSPHESSL